MSAAPPLLTQRELNRATLARQLLLERSSLSPLEGTRRLVSLQAQFPKPPYAGLWTRIDGFDRSELKALIVGRALVRATMMRHTLHLLDAADYARLRSAIQPALTRSFNGIAGKRLDGVDLERLLGVASEALAERPRTPKEIRELLELLEPGRDPAALAYAVRSFVPIVQVPTDAEHGFPPQPSFALAHELLGTPPQPEADLRELVLRYLAGFGPASVRDAQTWSGLSGLKATFETLRPELVTFRGDDGRELFDLPDAPRPDPDVPAPARFLPDFDNLMVSHADRTRVLPEEHRRRVSLPSAIVRATFLLDGIVAGAWKVERARGTAVLLLEPFGKLTRAQQRELTAEGERLLDFLEPAAGHELRVAGP